MVSHYLAKFGGHRFCGSRDIGDLILQIDLARPRGQSAFVTGMIEALPCIFRPCQVW